MLMFQGPDQIEFARSVGINTCLGNGWVTADKLGFSRNKEFLAQLAEAGLYGVLGPDARLSGQSNLLGWLQYDRPDAVKIQQESDVTLDPAHKPDRGFPLSRLVDGITANKQALISPMKGAEITIRLKEPVTAYSLAVWSEKGAPEDAKEIVFRLDGKEAVKGTLEDKRGEQKFPLPSPVTFRTLTLKVLSVYETDQTNKWGSLYEIQALDKEDKPLPLYTPVPVQAVPSECTGELYAWFTRMDSSRPVFVDLAAFGLKSPQGWPVDVSRKIYGDLLKQCSALGLETTGFARTTEVAAAVADLRVLAAPGRPVFACLDLGANGEGGKALTPHNLRAGAWAAIIAGASAIGYRVPADKGGTALGNEMKAELKRLNEEFTKLAPAILATPAQEKVEMVLAGGLACHARAGQLGGATYIFAQALDASGGSDPRVAKATIKLGGLKAGTKIEVVEENRSITGDDGHFTDDFAPLSEHVYKWGR